MVLSPPSSPHFASLPCGYLTVRFYLPLSIYLTANWSYLDRIQCDERHPVCRNCEKSKRDCLGYDPVFRPQPGPTTLQPAPSQPSLLGSPQGSPSYTSVHNSPTGSQSFAHPSLPTTRASSSFSAHQFDYGTNAIDPALEGAVSPKAGTHNTSEGGQTPSSVMYGTENLECNISSRSTQFLILC